MSRAPDNLCLGNHGECYAISLLFHDVVCTLMTVTVVETGRVAKNYWCMTNLPPYQRNDVAEDTIYNYDLTLFYFVFLHHTDLFTKQL